MSKGRKLTAVETRFIVVVVFLTVPALCFCWGFARHVPEVFWITLDNGIAALLNGGLRKS